MTHKAPYPPYPPHPHAEVLKAIADGEIVEYRINMTKPWAPRYVPHEGRLVNPINDSDFEWRVKPKMCSINGNEFPTPMKRKPALNAEYWVASTSRINVERSLWQNDDIDCARFVAGMCQETCEGAEAQLRAIVLGCNGIPIDKC
mgnify:CR=1 FL=1